MVITVQNPTFQQMSSQLPIPRELTVTVLDISFPFDKNHSNLASLQVKT